jgi:tRNA (mo5U34)-methyltransferase
VSGDLKSEKRIQLGSVELGIAIDAPQAERIRTSALYRYLIRPALNWIGKGGNGRSNGIVPNNTSDVSSPGATNGRSPISPEAREIIDLIADHVWYQSIELPHGVLTPGHVDHRGQLAQYHLPEDMTGMRVLDVATFDGFWAFEFERRGAEVVAIDVASTIDTDIPTNWRDEYEKAGLDKKKGEGFRIASELLGSKVEKQICSVYDLSPERLGQFDMTFCSDLLVHLRDPLRAIEAIWTVTKDMAIFADVYDPSLDSFKRAILAEFTHEGNNETWWQPSAGCYERWMQIARFSRVEEKSRFKLQSTFQDEVSKVVFHAYR